MKLEKILIVAFIFFTLTIFFGENVFAEELRMKNVIGIAEVYGDGEKISAAIIEYPKDIDIKKISAEDFSVDGKVIESVLVNDIPALTKKSKVGNYVILKFAYKNTAYDGELKPKKNSGNGDAPLISNRKPPDLSLTVKQIKSVTAADGTAILPAEMSSSKTLEPAIESFKQSLYLDPATGNVMPYNIFFPAGYDDVKKYPLIFFIPDASANINNMKTPLFQGNGATFPATSDFQRKNPCIIVAPQYTADLVNKLGMMTTDENVWTEGLTLTTNLLRAVIKSYAVDETRVYGIGQSQGGMANIAISDKYPDIFAAQLLVACQWNVDEMEILKDKNLWIVVCEGDTKAFPGMNAAVKRWENLGAKVARNSSFWDSKSSVDELNKKIRDMENRHANINYTVFKGGNHMYTWSFAYNISALYDWLFKQTLNK